MINKEVDVIAFVEDKTISKYSSYKFYDDLVPEMHKYIEKAKNIYVPMKDGKISPPIHIFVWLCVARHLENVVRRKKETTC